MVEIDNRKATLIAELEVSRGEIRHAFRSCEYQLDLAARVRHSVRSSPVTWLSGAALSGWLVSQILALRLGRPSPNVSQANAGNASNARSNVTAPSLVSALFKMGFELAKPALLEWIATRVTSLVTPQSSVADKTKSPTAPL
jgi:DNA-binding transcriptional MocR family regulator